MTRKEIEKNVHNLSEEELKDMLIDYMCKEHNATDYDSMTPEEVKAAIFDFITDEIDLDEVVNVEHQCGGCWIDFADGTTRTLSFQDCDME